MNTEEINFNQEEVNEYHDYADNRAQAQKLLKTLKMREQIRESIGQKTFRKVIWRDGQPTLVESTAPVMRTPGKNLSDGCPVHVGGIERRPSSWEAKRDAKNRKTYTLEETQTMNFKTSGHLPAHYYMDESALEAYVESLTKEK